MAACSKCGSVISEGASFCSVCGSPVSSIVSSSAAPENATAAAGAGLSSNVAAALAYLGFLVTGILFLLVEPYKKDRFVRFHAIQSICYTGLFVIFGIIWGNIAWLGFLSFGFAWTLVSFLGALIRLAFFAYWIYLMYKAYNRERYRIPFIGEFASKQAGGEG